MGQVVINGVRTMHVQNCLWALRGQRLIRARPKEIEELQWADVGDEESRREETLDMFRTWLGPVWMDKEVRVRTKDTK